jgi:threonine aldolase
MGEDPTVMALEGHLASRFNKESALFFPTGTQSNLCAILAHCDTRASEIMVGAQSHLCIYEQGNVATLGSVHSRQITECPDTATLPLAAVEACMRPDDPHYPKTKLVCIENTHNVMGGVPLPKDYVDSMGALCAGYDVPLHIDGARIFNAAVSLDTQVADLCAGAASVSVCLSKGLGSPVGSVLVGSKDIIDLARRARKACGGGMRQAGVIAAAGLFAVENNVDRLKDDHAKATFLAAELRSAGYEIEREPETNIIFFRLPEGSKLDYEELVLRCAAGGVKIGSGYSAGTKCRAALHKDITDEMIQHAARVMCDALK